MRNEATKISQRIISLARYAVTRCVRDEGEIAEFTKTVIDGVGEVAATAEARIKTRVPPPLMSSREAKKPASTAPTPKKKAAKK